MASTPLDPTNLHQNSEDRQIEKALRPKAIGEFGGQQKIVDNLSVFIGAAKMRNEALDHVLLHGPPGLGKTTLSYIISNELGANMRMTSGPVLEKPGDLAGLLTNLESGDVLFIQIQINPFTLIGATTRMGLLTAPMRARFGINCLLDYYDIKTLVAIIKRSADILAIPIADQGAFEIARRSRGTPRIANALLRRVRDFAQMKGDGTIDLEIAKYALNALNVDESGLDEMDNRILGTIIHKFKGGPVGLSTIATAVGEEQGTIEEVHEPFLIMEGYIQRTPRGREATPKAYKHLNVPMPSVPITLFDN